MLFDGRLTISFLFSFFLFRDTQFESIIIEMGSFKRDRCCQSVTLNRIPFDQSLDIREYHCGKASLQYRR